MEPDKKQNKKLDLEKVEQTIKKLEGITHCLTQLTLEIGTLLAVIKMIIDSIK